MLDIGFCLQFLIVLVLNQYSLNINLVLSRKTIENYTAMENKVDKLFISLTFFI